MRALLLSLSLGIALGGCVQSPEENFVGSGRSALELRAMQSRIIEGPQPQVARGVVSTMHDLGYRITRVDAGSGTISATRADRLRVSAVVREQEAGRSVVRANAVILMPGGKLHEVDAVEFYQMNFFAPLAAMLGREALAVPADSNVPEAVRPTPDRRPVPTATSPEPPQ